MWCLKYTTGFSHLVISFLSVLPVVISNKFFYSNFMFCFCLRYTFFSFCWFHKLFYTYRFVVIIDSLRHAWEPEDIQTHIWTCNLIKLYQIDFTVCLPVCQMTLKYIDLLLFYNELISTTIKKKLTSIAWPSYLAKVYCIISVTWFVVDLLGLQLYMWLIHSKWGKSTQSKDFYF